MGDYPHVLVRQGKKKDFLSKKRGGREGKKSTPRRGALSKIKNEGSKGKRTIHCF